MQITFIVCLLGVLSRSLMNQGNPPPYPGPGPTAPYPPYPQQPMGPEGYPPGPMGGPYPPPQGYPYQGYPQYGWPGGPQEPPKSTGTVMWMGHVYSWSSISAGSAPTDSTNHQIENIWGKKIPKSSKKQNLNLLCSTNYLHNIHVVFTTI